MELVALLNLFCSSCLLKSTFVVKAQIRRIFLDGYGVYDVRTASVFILPAGIIHDIEQLTCGFLWWQGDMKWGKVKLPWDDLCRHNVEDAGNSVHEVEWYNLVWDKHKILRHLLSISKQNNVSISKQNKVSYFVWKERNNRVHGKAERMHEQLSKIIVDVISFELAIIRFKKKTRVYKMQDMGEHVSTTNAITNKTQVSRNVINDFLALQNQARAAHRVPPLVWDPKLARYAAMYAKQRQQDCLLRHSNGPYGENIFWGSGNGWSPAQAAAAWVGERRWYAYRSNSCNGGQECGHYTQIVWKTTCRVGCAKVTCAKGRGVFMICNYDPPGNYIGEKPY
ncbi:pathogenesis-related protein PR-1-like protein [Tanacetum coccineum]